MKEFFYGVAGVTMAGLLCGAGMKPELNLGDRPEGPQIVNAFGGQRSTGPFDDGPALAAYRGAVPDYVLGTDWKKAAAGGLTPVVAEPGVARESQLPDVHYPDVHYDDARFDDAGYGNWGQGDAQEEAPLADDAPRPEPAAYRYLPGGAAQDHMPSEPATASAASVEAPG